MADNDNRPDSIRADAERMYQELSDYLLYHDGIDGKQVRLVPLGFRVKNFYRDIVVAELLSRLPELESDQPVRVQMARQVAGICDSEFYSTDFRIEAWLALEAVLNSLEPAGLSVVD